MTTAPPPVPDVVLHDGVSVPQLGFGVFLVPAAETERAVSAALEAGYRHIDTAAAYGNEAEVGSAIRSSGIDRESIFVTTKCFNGDHGHEQAKSACHASLERLDLGPIDLYLIHWPVPSQNLYLETWQGFIELHAEGLVRSIGVSNFQPAHLQRIVEETSVVPTVNQVELHPWLQQPELRRLHGELGIATEAWSPLARGRALDHPVLAAIGEHHRRTPAQVVLRWHVQIANIVIPKSVTPGRILENIDVFDFALDDDEVAAIGDIDRAERIGPDPDTFTRP